MNRRKRNIVDSPRGTTEREAKSERAILSRSHYQSVALFIAEKYVALIKATYTFTQPYNLPLLPCAHTFTFSHPLLCLPLLGVSPVGIMVCLRSVAITGSPANRFACLARPVESLVYSFSQPFFSSCTHFFLLLSQSSLTQVTYTFSIYDLRSAYFRLF